MPTIKRYSNRKLYDTEAKRYITLEGIADLIRTGVDIRVIDNATGEDLTTLTLTQIILDQEKKKSGYLPRTILAGIIQAGGDTLNTLQRSIVSPRTFWHNVDEEIKRRVQALIKQGELPENEGQSILAKLLSISHPNPPEPESEEAIQEEVSRILAEREIPTRGDLDLILRQLDGLASKLDELQQKQ
jgi:polyhydroxyalkanoate synthesis repressor PhaR